MISSEDMAIILLCQLPESYGSFYSSLIASGRMTDLTWEELVPMVLDEEDRFRTPSSGRGGSVGLTGQESQNQKKKKQGKGRAQQQL